MTPGLKLVVLIIDDDPDHADLLAEFVDACEHTAIVARTAAEALTLASQPVDLILVDLVLPDLHGTLLVTQIRALGVTCRIVATTGFPGKDVRDAAIKAGVSSFLLKPFALAKIRAEIDCVLASPVSD